MGLLVLGLGLGTSLFLPVPQNLKTNFDSGQSLYALGEYEGAIIEYSKIVKFHSRAVRADSVRVSFGDDLELPVVSAAWYQLGNAYKKSDQHGKAIEAYRQVVGGAKVPEHFRSLVQYEIAETRFLQREYEEAAKEYMRYVELFPKSEFAGKAFYSSGWSEFSLKQYDQSIVTLERMLAAYPQDKYAPDAQFRIASACFEKGDYPRAIELSRVVLEKYPESPIIGQAQYLEANSFDQLGRSQEAIASYRKVRALYDRMFELLRSSFREGKNVDFDSYRELFETSSLRVAEIFRKENQFEDAYKELVAAQETAEERFYKAKVQMRIGDNFMAWKRFDDAWSAYDQVINLYVDTPYPPNAQYNKGEARYYAGKYQDARQDYIAVVDNYPDSDTELRALALYNAGFASERLEELEQALALFTQAVESFPRSEQAPLCLLRIARIQHQKGRTDEARQTYLSLTDQYPDTRSAWDAYYGLGVLYRDQGQLDQALQAFGKVEREAGETYIAALTSSANIQIQKGQVAEGRRLLADLLQKVAGEPALEAQVYYQIAQVDLNDKKYPEAVKNYTTVIEKYPDSAPVRDSRYGRGLAYFHLGQYESSLADYKKLMESELPPAMAAKVKFSMALSYSAVGQNAVAEKLLSEVIASGDETLARSARMKLVVMAEQQNPAEAIKIYENMLPQVTTDEDRDRILLRLASAYFSLNQFDRSVELSQRLVDSSKSAEVLPNALFVQANSYFKTRDYARAVPVYRRVVDQYPQSSWALSSLFQIGVAYNELSANDTGALPQMAAAFKDFITKHPSDEKTIHAYYYGAWALYRLGKWGEAGQAFQELATQYPKEKYAPEAWFRAGEAFFNQRIGPEEKEKHFARAIDCFDQVGRLFPGSEYEDDALYSKAWCLISLKREPEAMAIFQDLVAKYPYERYGPKSQFTVGDYYYGLKQYEQAISSYQRFLELYPEDRLASQQDRQLLKKAETLLGHLGEINAYNLYVQGEQFLGDKNYSDAVKVFRQVMEKYPESDQAVNSIVQIGAVYQNQEDYREAGKVYREIIEKYGDKPKYETQVEFSKQQLKALEKAQVL
jgi:tetratricopeptide (TPR) repeat protein